MVTHEQLGDLMSIPSTGRSPHEKYAYGIDEACRLLSIGRTSLYEMAKRNEIQLIKVAGRTLVPRSELERLTSVSSDV